MPRSLRIEFPGAFYHVMARGNRRETIFHDDDDRRFFLATLSEACAMTGWRVHAWVLMGNHYHLFIETPEANLVAGMSWLQNTVTRRYNVRHMAWGRLFGDRYKAVLVEGADTYHYRTLADYIHLNPVRARLVVPKKGQSVLDYPWSSVAGGWALPPGKRPKWLAAEEGLKRFDLPDTVAGRRRMVERLDRRAVEEEIKKCGMPVIPEDVDARCSHLRRGWYWGSQEFAGKLREAFGKADEGAEEIVASLPESATGDGAQRGTGEALAGRGAESGGTRGKGSAGLERIGSAEAGPGGAALETDDGFAGMDRGKTVDAQRGEREPATAPFQSSENNAKLPPEMQSFLKEAWDVQT